jgi:hypothetical protein
MEFAPRKNPFFVSAFWTFLDATYQDLIFCLLMKVTNFTVVFDLLSLYIANNYFNSKHACWNEITHKILTVKYQGRRTPDRPNHTIWKLLDQLRYYQFLNPCNTDLYHFYPSNHAKQQETWVRLHFHP